MLSIAGQTRDPNALEDSLAVDLRTEDITKTLAYSESPHAKKQASTFTHCWSHVQFDFPTLTKLGIVKAG